MIRSVPHIFVTTGMALAILSLSALPASALILDAIQDTWIRAAAPDTDYNDDLISVWDGMDAVDQMPRNGAIMFDLTSTVGVPITSAVLQLYDRDDTRSANTQIVQEMYILSITPPNEGFGAPYTWNEYIAFDQPNEVLLQSLGHYNIAAGDTVDGYEASATASASDISLLEQTRDNNSNLVAFILKSTAGERDWGDITEGTPPRLFINESPPVLGDFTGDGMVKIEDYNVLIDPLNWLQTVPNGTRGDMNNNGFVDLVDFSIFKPIYLAANPPPLESAVNVPEPNGFVLLLTALSVVGFVYGSKRQWRLCNPAKAIAGTILAFSLTATTAQAIILDAISEVWLRESGPTTTFENDLISVWNSFGNDSGTRRYGVVEFDVSSLTGIQLDLASLNLWNGDNGFSDDDKAIKQTASYINTTGGTAASSLTWNIYQSEYAGSATPFESFGFYDLPAQPAPIAYSNSASASAFDLGVISSAVSSGNQRLTLVLIADEADQVEYAHSWGDGTLGSSKPQLLINEVPPEIVKLTLQVRASDGKMWITNPGVDPTVNTTFDIDGYVIHSPDAKLNPGGFTGLSGAGQPDWGIVAPTATDLSETNLLSSTLFEEGDSLLLGTGFTPGAAEDAGLTFFYNVAGGSPVQGVVEYVTGGLTGDYNNDGLVNAADYVLWRDGGSSDSSPAGYEAWKSNFGGGNVGSGNSATIPEPSSLGMLALLLAISGATVKGRSFRKE